MRIMRGVHNERKGGEQKMNQLRSIWVVDVGLQFGQKIE